MSGKSIRLKKIIRYDAIICRSSRVVKARLLLFLAGCLFSLMALPVKVSADSSGSIPLWAFDNDGTYSYEDNDSSWYSGTETVQAKKGIDINLLPVREGNYTFGRECVVALIDTGVNINHNAFAGRLWKNTGEIPDDGIDNDGNGFIDDVDGWNFYKNSNVMYNSRSSTEDAHGTHLAGTIVGNDQLEGYLGIAGNIPTIKLMPVKTVGGPNQSGSVEDLIQGIKYAEMNGADICNISLAFENWDEDVYKTIKESKMLFIAAAGNGGTASHGKGTDLGSSKRYPACYGLDNVIVVANMKCDGKLHYSSNYSTDYVDIAAPGTQIRSTSTHKSGYEVMTGTSMAVPMVSGAAALVYSEHTDWDIMQVKQAIISSAVRLESLAGKVAEERMLDIAAAMEYKGKNTETPRPTSIPTQRPTPTPTPFKPEITQAPQFEEDKDTDKKTDIINIEPVGIPETTINPIIEEMNEKVSSYQVSNQSKTEKKKVTIKLRNIKWYHYGNNTKRLVFNVKANQKAEGYCLKISRKKKGKSIVKKRYIAGNTMKWNKIRANINVCKGESVSVSIQVYRNVKKAGIKDKQCIGSSKTIISKRR